MLIRARGKFLKLISVCAFMSIILAVGHTTPSEAIDVDHAIKLALEANPEIGEAIANREAIEFERDQAKGLFLPKIDFEGRTGAQNRDSPFTRATGLDDNVLFRNEANIIASQLLFDGWESRGELERQAARVDGASHRIFERSEFIALNVIRQYLEVGRLLTIVSSARENISYHNRILSDMREGAGSGGISETDVQQAEERVSAANARLIEFTEELNSAKIRFFRLVGEKIGRYHSPRWISASLPPNLSAALGTARQLNPILKIINADIDAAYALRKKARSEFFPKVTLEGTARAGDDLDGVRGRETDLRAEVVVRWNLFKGGIDSANTQEQVRRIDEQRFKLHTAHREIEEAVRLSWERRVQQRRRLTRLEDQLTSANELIDAYKEQFKVGRRSLLDLLDTQNTRFNTQVSVETARVALKFAEYRVLASAGILLTTLQIIPPEQSNGYAREAHHVPETPPAETMKRWQTSVVPE